MERSLLTAVLPATTIGLAYGQIKTAHKPWLIGRLLRMLIPLIILFCIFSLRANAQAPVYTQYGSLLSSSSVSQFSSQGASVAISGDGKTAIVGVPGSNSPYGLAIVYNLVAGVWTQTA